MTFRFDTRKATETASLFIKLEGGKLNIMKLVKLVYLLDRLSITKRGLPVVGGVYYSMRNGPVTSELLDIINAGKLANDSDSSWEEFISDRNGHMVALREQAPAITAISQAEIKLIEQIYAEHGKKDQWEIRDWCHAHCGEWTSLENGRTSIPVEAIAKNVGKTDREIQSISEEAKELNLLTAAFNMVAVYA